MTTVGAIQTELIYSRPTGNASASAIVEPDVFDHLEDDMRRLGCDARWSFDNDPNTGERRPAFRPIEGGRLALIEDQGIRHGDRFVARFDVNEVTRNGVTGRQMWLVEARPVLALLMPRR